MMTRAVNAQGYTQEELQYAVHKLMVDPELDKKLQFPGGRITAADFQRHIDGLRKLKRTCDPSAQLSRFEVSRIVEQFPNEIGWENFGVCGYTKDEDPLYRFSKQPIQNISPTPSLAEENPAQRESGGLSKLGDLL